MKKLCVTRGEASDRQTLARTRLAACRHLGGAFVLAMLISGATAHAEPSDETPSVRVGNEAALPSSSAVSGNLPGQERAADEVNIRDAWMQHVGQGNSHVAAYFAVENTADSPHLIDGVSSPSCSAMYGYHSDLEVSHLTRSLFTHLTVPANQILVFPPGGYHLVCTVADGKTVNVGDVVEVHFHFLGGSSKAVQFTVREAKPFGTQSYNNTQLGKR